MHLFNRFCLVQGDAAKIVKKRHTAQRFVRNPELWTERAQASSMNYDYELDPAETVRLVQMAMGHVYKHELSPFRRQAGDSPAMHQEL